MGQNNNYDGVEFYDNQTVELDLDTLYNKFIEEIDAIRSRFATPDQIGLTQLDAAKIQSAISSGRANSNNTPQESRCNAFYRLLGLPIFSENGLYNPGHHPDLNTNKDLLNKRLSRANSLLSNQALQLKLSQRESFPKTMLGIFSKQDLNASLLAYSVKFLRPITGLVENDDPLAVEEQSYPFKQRLDGAQHTENYTKTGASIFHILKPFMPDPRIDFIVYPSWLRVAVPFLPDDRRKASNGVYYKAPFIEKACRVRLAVRNEDGELPDLEKVAQDIKDNSNITDQDLLNVVSGISRYYRSEAYILNNLIKVFRILVDALFDAVQTIDNVESKIHWVPVPDPRGMEINVTSSNFIPNDPYGMKIDQELDRLTKLKAVNDNEIDMLKTDLGVATDGAVSSSAFSALDNIAFGSILSNVPTKFDNQITNLTNLHDQLASKAAKALRNISIIMGDTTGLGLLDMYAIYAALWTVDKTTLVNMLDDDAFARLNAIPELQSSEVSARAQGTTQQPLVTGTKFQTKVLEMYNIIDNLLKAKIGNS